MPPEAGAQASHKALLPWALPCAQGPRGSDPQRRGGLLASSGTAAVEPGGCFPTSSSCTGLSPELFLPERGWHSEPRRCHREGHLGPLRGVPCVISLKAGLGEGRGTEELPSWPCTAAGGAWSLLLGAWSPALTCLRLCGFFQGQSHTRVGSFLLSPLSPPWTPEGPTACPPHQHICLGCDEVPPVSGGRWGC